MPDGPLQGHTRPLLPILSIIHTLRGALTQTWKPIPVDSSHMLHRVQRSEVRAERLVFLAKDNRHNMLRTCVTRVTYIFTAGHFVPRSESEEKPLPFGQRVRRPRKTGLRLIAIFNIADDTKRDRDQEIQRMEREESRSNWIHKGCIRQIY